MAVAHSFSRSRREIWMHIYRTGRPSLMRHPPNPKSDASHCSVVFAFGSKKRRKAIRKRIKPFKTYFFFLSPRDQCFYLYYISCMSLNGRRLASVDFDTLVIWRTRDPMSFTFEVIFSFSLCFVSWFQIADAIFDTNAANRNHTT